MNLAEGFSAGLNGLFANKLRSGLTILGIIIGVSAVIAMVSIGEGAKQAIIKRIESMGSNLLGVGIGKLMSKAMSGGTLSSVVSPSSIILSFCFAVGIGIFFGMYPANKASKLEDC